MDRCAVHRMMDRCAMHREFEISTRDNDLPPCFNKLFEGFDGKQGLDLPEHSKRRLYCEMNNCRAYKQRTTRTPHAAQNVNNRAHVSFLKEK